MAYAPKEVAYPNRQAMRESLHEEGIDDFYQYVPEMKETFPLFWWFLQELATFGCTCRTGGGGPLTAKFANVRNRKAQKSANFHIGIVHGREIFMKSTFRKFGRTTATLFCYFSPLPTQ